MSFIYVVDEASIHDGLNFNTEHISACFLASDRMVPVFQDAAAAMG